MLRFNKKYIIYTFAVFFTLCLFLSSAQAIIFDTLKPLTPIELMPEAEFIEKTQLIEEIPYDDEFLDYEIRLPKDFKLSASKLNISNFAENVSQRVLGVVTRYVGPPVGTVRSSFVLEALELTYEISARNWFIAYVIENGLSLEQVGKGSDKDIEALYIEIIDSVTYIVRMKAVKNGPRIIMARYYLPREVYEQDRVLQAQIINSFKLKNTDINTVEELKGYGFLDQTYIKYPETWELDAPYIRSIDRMSARIFRNVMGDRLDGQINLYISKKDSEKTRSEEIKFYKEKLILSMYQLGGFLEKVDFEYTPEMKIGMTEVYKLQSLRKNFLDYEVWFTFLENKDYYYFVIMYTPERDVTFDSWARNYEAYRILLKNITRINNDPNFMKIIR